jgi:hypothetical protein
MATNARLIAEKKPSDVYPIDKHGRPTTYLAFRILKLMFSQPRKLFTPKELAKLLAAKHSDTELICRQLKRIDFFSEDPSQPGKYKYNLKCKNADAQAALESYLAEVYRKAIPVYLILDYSPSYRLPADPRTVRF